MDGSGFMDGSLFGIYTFEHAFHEDGLRPDIIGARPPELYLQYVNQLASAINEKFNLGNGENGWPLIDEYAFEEMAKFASERYDENNPDKGSLIGIMNYHVAAKNGESEFYVQFGRGSLWGGAWDLSNMKAHKTHLENTREYLRSRGLVFREEATYQTFHYAGPNSKTYQEYSGTKFIIIDTEDE